MTTVAVAHTQHASYFVKQISPDPLQFVAFVETPDLGISHIHRDGRTQADALRAVANHIEGVEGTLSAIANLMSKEAVRQ